MLRTTGKNAGDETFPVATLFLPARIRARVLEFYAFARMADDIADDPDLAPQEKLARLDALQPPNAHAALLLEAFRRDARNQACADWDDLMDYCRLSAVPVGRFLLELHGETCFAPADALCSALQVLNHLQDRREDEEILGRRYFAMDSMAALEKVAHLLEEAAPLPDRIRDRGLRRQAAATLHVARAQFRALHQGRKTSRLAYVAALMRGALA